ncbi:hypothetical protein M5D96_006078, partial [Drosophila gunungcola]
MDRRRRESASAVTMGHWRAPSSEALGRVRRPKAPHSAKNRSENRVTRAELSGAGLHLAVNDCPQFQILFIFRAFLPFLRAFRLFPVVCKLVFFRLFRVIYHLGYC